MAWGAILGSLLNAGGQIAGGAVASSGQQKPSEQIQPTYNPALDYAFQAQQFDALNQLGFGNIFNIPDPMQQLAGRVNSAMVDNKTKRRALVALQNIMQDPTLLDDPYGLQYTRDQVFEANKTGNVPFGRVVTRGPEGSGIWNTKQQGGMGGATKGGMFMGGTTGDPVSMLGGAILGGTGLGKKFMESPLMPGNSPLSKVIFRDLFGVKGDTEPTGLPIRNIGRLQQALGAVGITLQDLQDTARRTALFKAQIKKLEDAGVGQMNTDAILGRYKAASEAAKLAGGAANFIGTGNAELDPAMSQLKQQDDYAMARAQEKLGLMANFGGMNQASVMSALANMQNTQNPRLVERALALSGALGGALQGGQAANQSAGAQGYNSAQLAAQQANALNSLRAGTADARASSLGNGIAGGASGIGSDISNYAMLQSNRAYQQQQTEANNKAMLDMIKSLNTSKA